MSLENILVVDEFPDNYDEDKEYVTQLQETKVLLDRFISLVKGYDDVKEVIDELAPYMLKFLEQFNHYYAGDLINMHQILGEINKIDDAKPSLFDGVILFNTLCDLSLYVFHYRIEKKIRHDRSNVKLLNTAKENCRNLW